MTRSTRLWIVLGLNAALVGVLVAVGLAAHSLGVLAEGADYLADAGAIGLSLFAIWLSKRPPTPTRPGGYPWATAIAALLNGCSLLAFTLLVAAGAIDRLATGAPPVHGLPVLVVSGIAALTMVIGALILRGDREDLGDEGGVLNMRSVVLDTAADAAIAAGVATTGAIMLATGGLYWLDPTVALVVSVVVGFHTVRLLRQVAAVLRKLNSYR